MNFVFGVVCVAQQAVRVDLGGVSDLQLAGWRLKAQLKGRQHKIFILDFFGSDKPHANLGVPPIQHLTAFPVPASQSRTFLGYRVDSR